MKLQEADHHSRKFPEYYEYYDRHFSELREKPLKILEIGVQYGGSIKMWTNYFPHAHITGIDVDPACKIHAGRRVDIKIGDQSDEKFLSQFTGYDIIIDDGGHTMKQQQVSFNVLFPLLSPGGLYVIEDLHTSYWPEFFDHPETTMDVLAKMTHAVNAEASRHERAKGRPPIEDIGIDEMHFYGSMCFIHKKAGEKQVLVPPKREGGLGYKTHRFIHKLKDAFKR